MKFKDLKVGNLYRFVENDKSFGVTWRGGPYLFFTIFMDRWKKQSTYAIDKNEFNEKKYVIWHKANNDNLDLKITAQQEFIKNIFNGWESEGVIS